ncbi:hypothetical protein DFJ74DRAFT_515905, partial [Hyaloraphidium curvatum]
RGRAGRSNESGIRVGSCSAVRRSGPHQTRPFQWSGTDWSQKAVIPALVLLRGGDRNGRICRLAAGPMTNDRHLRMGPHIWGGCGCAVVGEIVVLERRRRSQRPTAPEPASQISGGEASQRKPQQTPTDRPRRPRHRKDVLAPTRERAMTAKRARDARESEGEFATKRARERSPEAASAGSGGGGRAPTPQPLPRHTYVFPPPPPFARRGSDLPRRQFWDVVVAHGRRDDRDADKPEGAKKDMADTDAQKDARVASLRLPLPRQRTGHRTAASCRADGCTERATDGVDYCFAHAVGRRAEAA